MSNIAIQTAIGLTNFRTLANLSQTQFLNDSNSSLTNQSPQSTNSSSIIKSVNKLPKFHIKSSANYLRRDSKASSIPLKRHLLFTNTSIDDSVTTFRPIQNQSSISTTITTTTTTSTNTRIQTETNESIDDLKNDNSFTISFLIIFLVLWNIYGFFIQIKILFFTESKESTNQFFDNCTIKTSYFKYMIRLKYSDLVGGYQLNNGTIMIDLLDAKDRFITRLTIPPNWFFTDDNKTKSKSNKVIKFRLNRKIEFPEIGSMKITHDLFTPDGSAICIQNIQIKDLNNNKLINVPINRPIKALGPDAKFIEQMFEANKPIPIEPDEDMFNDEIVPDVTITELFMFIFIYVNLSLMFTMISKYLTSTIQNKSLTLFISCLVPNALSLFLLLCIIKLYQRFVKELFIFKTGSDEWRLTRIIFLILNLAFSMISNILSVWVITLVKTDLDTFFLICTPIFSLLSILILFSIYSYSKFQISKRLKLKEGSLTMLNSNLQTKEKQTLQIPLDEFALRNSKEQAQIKS